MKRWLPVLLILVFVGLSLGSADRESLTYDEIVHEQEGINALTRHTFLIDTNNPPLVRELAMLPKVHHVGIPPRFIIILMAVTLLTAVYMVTKRYFGNTQALLAIFLLALEPNLLANSHYVTLDTGLTLFFFLAYVAYLRWPAFAAGAMFGLAAASKLFALPFFLGSALFVKRRLSFRKTVFTAISFSICAGVVVWATYFFTFDKIIISREDSTRLSSRLHTYAATHHIPIIENTLHFFETQKLPLGNYLAVIKNTFVRWRTPQKIFFLGTFYNYSRWYFLPVNLIYKIPLPLWILFILGLIAGRGKFVAPILVIIAFVSLSGTQPWIRYVLPALPFIVIIASGSVKFLSTGFRKIVFFILIIWYAESAASSFPHFISYANELAGLPDTRFTKFMDSNLDWGQGLPDVATFVRQNKPSHVRFSYFGRDNGALYGLASAAPYGSYTFEDICAFHEIDEPYPGPGLTLVSVSNWYYCGYYKWDIFSQAHVRGVIGNSILIFYE